MDWDEILATMGADRLARLAASAGIQRATTAKKALIEALKAHLDDALKAEALSMLSIEQLREIARAVRPSSGASRKHDLISVLLSSERAEDELELSEMDFLLPDRGRLDLPEGHNLETAVEVLPCRPTGRAEPADVTLALEVQQLLRRPELRRAVIVVPTSHSTILARLLTHDLDDLVESAVRYVDVAREERAALTFVLDGERHALGETATGKALVALATELRGVVEIRLTSTNQRLRAQVLAFEEQRAHGAFMTAIVGGGALPGLVGDEHRPSIEANLRIAGAIASSGVPCSLVKEWIAHLLRDARSLTRGQLLELGPSEDVIRKVAYKRELDTAHELALKHLAEHICRRGRVATPLFDPTTLDPPPRHQHEAICLAGRPHQGGALLLDDAGLGKTVEVGLILARELRRRRVLASPLTMERRRALVVAPTSLHGHWREELTAKWGLDVLIFDPDGRPERAAAAQVLVCGPSELRRSWEDVQGADVLVVDEAMLFGEETLRVLAKLRKSVELCIVTSSAPAFDDPADLLGLAGLARPDDGFAELGDLLNDELAVVGIGEELRDVCARSRRADLPAGALSSRAMFDRTYALDEVEVAAYAELRRMRTDYLARGDHEHTGAFAALEHTFLSSHQAFAGAAQALLAVDGKSDGELLGAETGDPSYAFLRQSGYFKRRIRAVRDTLGGRVGPAAPLSSKEATMLAVLAECKRKPVVILVSYRASATRIRMVLARAKITGEVELIDEDSTIRERLGVVTRFRERCAGRSVSDGPSGVLVCTDASAEELNLERAAFVLVNFDLPWNPQAVERRIGRLARWGQRDGVEIYNLVAMHPERPMWTMDSRIAYACRELFAMADGAASPALYEVEPSVLVTRLTEDDAPELSLMEEPDPEAIAEVDAWLGHEREAWLTAATDRAIADDALLRERLEDLWKRVAHGQGTLSGARGHLFGRLQQALLQGMVGVLCAPDRTIDDCEDWHLVVGLRLLVESAAVEVGVEPWVDAPEDVWLVEDEVVHLWAVSPDGELMDWAEFLLGEGLVEVPSERAARIVDRGVLDYLFAEKRSLETRHLDGVPLSDWLTSAPEPLGEKLAVVAEHAQAMAEVRHAEIEAAWAEAKDARLVRLDARRHLVEGHPSAKAATEAALARAHAEDVSIRHEVLGTQLFIVTH